MSCYLELDPPQTTTNNHNTTTSAPQVRAWNPLRQTATLVTGRDALVSVGPLAVRASRQADHRAAWPGQRPSGFTYAISDQRDDPGRTDDPDRTALAPRARRRRRRQSAPTRKRQSQSRTFTLLRRRSPRNTREPALRSKADALARDEWPTGVRISQVRASGNSEVTLSSFAALAFVQTPLAIHTSQRACVRVHGEQSLAHLSSRETATIQAATTAHPHAPGPAAAVAVGSAPPGTATAHWTLSGKLSGSSELCLGPSCHPSELRLELSQKAKITLSMEQPPLHISLVRHGPNTSLSTTLDTPERTKKAVKSLNRLSAECYGGRSYSYEYDPVEQVYRRALDSTPRLTVTAPADGGAGQDGLGQTPPSASRKRSRRHLSETWTEAEPARKRRRRQRLERGKRFCVSRPFEDAGSSSPNPPTPAAEPGTLWTILSNPFGIFSSASSPSSSLSLPASTTPDSQVEACATADT